MDEDGIIGFDPLSGFKVGDMAGCNVVQRVAPVVAIDPLQKDEQVDRRVEVMGIAILENDLRGPARKARGIHAAYRAARIGGNRPRREHRQPGSGIVGSRGGNDAKVVGDRVDVAVRLPAPVLGQQEGGNGDRAPRYFLQLAGGSSVVGVYALAYQFGFLLAVVGYVPFGLIWEPIRFEIAERADRDEVYSKGFVYLNVFQITVAVSLALFIDEILRVMTTPPFYPASTLVPIVLGAYVLQGWANVQDIGIHVRKRTEFITAANWLAAAVAMLGYAIFIPRYLGMGAAWVTVVAFLVRYLALYVTSQTIWPVRYHWRPIWWMVGMGIAAVSVGTGLPTLDWWITVPAKLSILVAYLGGLVVTGVVPPSQLRQGLARIAARRGLSSPLA